MAAHALVGEEPGRTLSETLLTRAQALLAIGRNREALEATREAAHLARTFAPPRVLHHVLVVQIDAMIALGEIESAARVVTELTRATSDGADPHAWAHTLRLRATVAFAHGEPSTEHQLYDAFTAFEQAGTKLTFGMTYLLVITMWRAGRMQEALAVIDRSFEQLRDLENRDGLQTLFHALEFCLCTLSGTPAPQREFAHQTQGDTEHERIAQMAMCIARNEPLPMPTPDEPFFVREFRQCSGQAVEVKPDAQTSISITGEWIARSGNFAPLTHRPNLMRILAALADARVSAPGRSLESEKLLAMGWPGERVRADAGRQRVRTALATLRDFGLKSVLVTTREGWHLATDGSCVVVANPRDDGRASAPPQPSRLQDPSSN
jgi:ATP/maltotriose-dependent transcriptional regulator MalT